MKNTFLKYWRIYMQIMKMALSLLTEYRFNLFIQGIYMVTYMVGLLFILQSIFSQTHSLGGWTKDELLMQFSVFTFMWGIIEMCFFDGLRRFVIAGVKNGEIDKFITKPASTQFLVAFSSPDISVLPHQLFAAIIFIRQLLILKNEIAPLNALLFIITFFSCIVTLFFIYSAYSSLAFHVTNSSQVLRSMETLTDSSQYPTTIFPQYLQPILFSLVPVAFLGFLPTSFLLGKAPLTFAGVVFFIPVLAFFVNQFLWSFGLKKYSSVSS